jgi:hypothetical protein
VRLVRAAQNASRRHFSDPATMHRWMSEILTPEESARLRVFLTAGSSIPPGRAP